MKKRKGKIKHSIHFKRKQFVSFFNSSYYSRALTKLKELRDTERSYVNGSLREVVEGYCAYMEETKAQMREAAEKAMEAPSPTAEGAGAAQAQV